MPPKPFFSFLSCLLFLIWPTDVNLSADLVRGASRAGVRDGGKSPQPSDRKLIALTFDDGPYPGATERILAELKKRRVKATFFVCGYRIQTWSRLVQRAADEGHEIGNHSWSHPNLTALPPEGIRRQMESTQAEIQRVTGRRPQVMRPPFGAYNRRIAPFLGLPAIIWSVESSDYSIRNPDRIVDTVVARIHPGGIVLMHDRWSAKAIGRIVDILTSRGYEFVTVSQLLGFDRNPASAVPGKAYYRAARPVADGSVR